MDLPYYYFYFFWPSFLLPSAFLTPVLLLSTLSPLLFLPYCFLPPFSTSSLLIFFTFKEFSEWMEVSASVWRLTVTWPKGKELIETFHMESIFTSQSRWHDFPPPRPSLHSSLLLPHHRPLNFKSWPYHFSLKVHPLSRIQYNLHPLLRPYQPAPYLSSQISVKKLSPFHMPLFQRNFN